jgi:selenocysteine lyase/cysteine desulfurase
LASPDRVVFAPNTHEFVLRIASAIERRPLRILTTDGEFHSFRRQAARWAEAGQALIEIVPMDPARDFEERLIAAARRGAHDLIYVSQVSFRSGRMLWAELELAETARPEGPWVVFDGYHAFMALPSDLSELSAYAFYLAGGYKYAMAGEGAAFLVAPPGFGPRPVDTGWFAEFGELSGPPGGVGFASNASRFAGATFDPSGLYRLNAVFDLMAREGLDTQMTCLYARTLRDAFAEAVARGRCGRLDAADVLTPLGDGARFLAFQHADASHWMKALARENVVTDVRDDVLRVGFGLYQDMDDVGRLIEICGRVLR